MAGPLLETKLHVPRRRRGLVARPRLSERLSRGAESTLTLVSAPAGFGKTTLLAEWLAAAPADGRSAAWLSLDQRDNDPALFWTYLIAALQTAAPGVGAGALSLLQSPQPPIEAVLATLLNDLGAVSNDVVLVLDDYHVIDARDIQDGMAFLLEHLPAAAAPGDRQPRRPGAAAGSPARARRARRDPRRRPALHARRGRGVPQRGDGAGADGSRTSQRWRGAPKGGSPRSSWRRSRCRAETTSPASSRASPGTTATSSTTWSKRSCSASPSMSGSFLLQTSILDRLSGPLCDAVTGQDGGKAMLEALERGNLFLVPLDDRRQWYRYHHLFADVLRARLLDEQPDRRSVSCTGGRATGTSRTASRPRRSATRWPPRTSSERRTWSSWRFRPCAGAGRRPRCVAGSRRCPTRWSGSGPCSASGMPGRCCSAASSRASRPGCGTPSGGWTRRPVPRSGTGSLIGGDGRRRRRGVSPPPGDDRAVPCRAGPGSGRRARHREARPAGARAFA